MEEIKDLLRAIKPKQDTRNKMLKKEGRSLANQLTVEIEEFFSRADTFLEELQQILRTQAQGDQLCIFLFKNN